MNSFLRQITRLVIAALVSVTAFAQVAKESPPGEIAGHYEGFAQATVYGRVPLVVEIRYDKQAIVGSMHTPLGDFNIAQASYADGKWVFKAESYDDEGVITVNFKAGRFVGVFDGFGDKGTVELVRTGPPSPVLDTTPTDNLSKTAWREDLQFLASELPRRHANAFHFVTREQFARAVRELNARIPQLQNSDIVMGLSRIVAMIGDGHTHLGWGRIYRGVPLRMFWFGNQLRVTGASAKYRKVIGTRVVEIGGVSLAEAYARELPYISQDESEGFLRSAHADLSTYPAHLHALGLAPDITHAQYTFLSDRGERFKLSVPIINPGEQVAWIDAERRMPLYKQREKGPLWFTYLAREQTLYFNFKAYPRRKDFIKFSRELFDFIDHHAIQRVVVDLRQNGGGDFTRGRDYIISEFKKRPGLTRTGRLYVIIGRWTYSAGMANAADFRNDLHAILVGEPTGARPNGYQENRAFSLPNSHLDVSYSTQLYKFQEQDTPGIMPDKRIDPDWLSYRQGRDPALAWILKQPQPSGQ
jgi:Peptidase family S41